MNSGDEAEIGNIPQEKYRNIMCVVILISFQNCFFLFPFMLMGNNSLVLPELVSFQKSPEMRD